MVTSCTNLLSDVSYCVTPVEDINNYPGAPGYVPSYSTIAWDSLPSATYKPVLKPHKLPLARGTAKDCQVYADGGDLQYDFGVTPCKAAEVIWEINEQQLLDWNPSLRSDSKSNDTSCSFETDKRYCLQMTGWGANSSSSSSAGSPTSKSSATSK